MKIGNCWKLKLLKFLQVLLIVSVTTFSDIIFRFPVYCEHWVSLSEKSKDGKI